MKSMKKLISLFLASMMVFCLSACSTSVKGDTEKPSTVTIKALNANKELADIEVPYDPQRIAILDMAALDIVDSLGLGDRIVGSAKVTIEYYFYI